MQLGNCDFKLRWTQFKSLKIPSLVPASVVETESVEHSGVSPPRNWGLGNIQPRCRQLSTVHPPYVFKVSCSWQQQELWRKYVVKQPQYDWEIKTDDLSALDYLQRDFYLFWNFALGLYVHSALILMVLMGIQKLEGGNNEKIQTYQKT